MDKLIPRPPIVCVLGHVDHGKTTLLDYIRKSRLTTKEHGGITQKIGAYEVVCQFKGYLTNKITFIDTPGHEAFSQMRARGANIADMAILIIDAKDSVMLQTIESISHIKAAKIPFIVAINKIDLPDANIEKVKSDLVKNEVLIEGKGGNIPTVSISAKTGKGINELLETILLLSSELNLTYNQKNSPKAYIIETKKDKRGVVVSVIIKDGKLKIGDLIYVEGKKVKIRSMINDLGQPANEVLPSTPFELLGFDELPEVGSLITTEIRLSAKKIEKQINISDRKIDLDLILHPPHEEKQLSVIIKADSQGALEAICNSLCQKDSIKIILKAVGDINKSDTFLAKTTKSIIIGFNVDVPFEVKDLIKQEKIILKTYNIIYELLEELEEVAKLLKEKEEKEKNLKAEVKILATFIIEKEKVYGVKVNKGKINLDDQIDIYRENKLIGKSKIVSLKIRAKKVNEVKKNQEAGIIVFPPLDIRIGDVIKSIL